MEHVNDLVSGQVRHYVQTDSVSSVTYLFQLQSTDNISVTITVRNIVHLQLTFDRTLIIFVSKN